MNFIGDDWKRNLRWEQNENDLGEYGMDIVFTTYRWNSVYFVENRERHQFERVITMNDR